MTNKIELMKLDALLKDSLVLNSLDSIAIYASASVEGNEYSNQKLAENRALSVKNYIISKYDNIEKEDFFILHAQVGSWDQINAFLNEHPNTIYRDEIVKVIHSNHTVYEKELILRKIDQGKVWKYLTKEILPYQRYGNSITLYLNKEISKSFLKQVKSYSPSFEKDTVLILPKRMESEYYSLESYKKNVIALKTNLLSDLGTALNIGLEIPISNNWSVEAQYTNPWWRGDRSNLTFQLQMLNLGVNYWFGERAHKELLTGWHAGVMGGTGKYDFQLFKENGIQGKFYNVSLGLGYSHKIAPSFHLNYGAYLGLLRSDYKKYDMEFNTKFGDIKVFRYPWETKRYTWLGPTQLEVSLVWLIGYKTKRISRNVK